MQRFFDIFFSAIALLILSPLLIPIMIALRLTGEGEIFYKQNRIGHGGKSFGLLKFATMLKNSPNIGSGNITLKNDPRVLPMGNFLRKTKINELPQLINILTGDMSVIGPRPLTKDNFDIYPVSVKSALYKIRPGLSGIGSIVFRAEENMLDNREDPRDYYCKFIAPYKGELERWYTEKRMGFYTLL